MSVPLPVPVPKLLPLKTVVMRSGVMPSRLGAREATGIDVLRFVRGRLPAVFIRTVDGRLWVWERPEDDEG